MPDGSILILVMAEEKWSEADFLRREIHSLGFDTLLLDMGLTGSAEGSCDITREEIISLSGFTGEDAAAITDRGKRMPLMVAGASKKAKKLYENGNLAGVISIGGTTGTQTGTSIMKTLPFGFPKLAVSSNASHQNLSHRFFGGTDITVMNSVVEFGGVNDLMKNVLSRAAGAICGMAATGGKYPVSLSKSDKRPLVAMTQLGLCEVCADTVRQLLEKKGYQVIGFSAAGTGDRAMEEMIKAWDIFSAVIDLSPGGVGEELLGFTRAAGPLRLEAAGNRGLPQVVSLCAVNLGSPAKSSYTPEIIKRKKFDYDAARTQIRLSAEELTRIAGVMAEKLNRSTGPVRVVIPLGGWSVVDRRGTDFYDGDLDKAFTDELKKRLKPEITVTEVDADLDTAEFAEAVVGAFDEVMVLA